MQHWIKINDIRYGLEEKLVETNQRQRQKQRLPYGLEQARKALAASPEGTDHTVQKKVTDQSETEMAMLSQRDDASQAESDHAISNKNLMNQLFPPLVKNPSSLLNESIARRLQDRLSALPLGELELQEKVSERSIQLSTPDMITEDDSPMQSLSYRNLLQPPNKQIKMPISIIGEVPEAQEEISNETSTYLANPYQSHRAKLSETISSRDCNSQKQQRTLINNFKFEYGNEEGNADIRIEDNQITGQMISQNPKPGSCPAKTEKAHRNLRIQSADDDDEAFDQRTQKVLELIMPKKHKRKRVKSYFSQMTGEDQMVQSQSSSSSNERALKQASQDTGTFPNSNKRQSFAKAASEMGIKQFYDRTSSLASESESYSQSRSVRVLSMTSKHAHEQKQAFLLQKQPQFSGVSYVNDEMQSYRSLKEQVISDSDSKSEASLTSRELYHQ